MFNENVIKASLSSAEVQKQIELGKVNIGANSKSKSIKHILFDNICSIFNLINVILFVLLILVGSYKNTLFMGVALFNTLIGIFQEIRSKIMVDRLSIVTTSKVDAVRDNKIQSIPSNDIVCGDILKLCSGVQVPADCEVIDGFCLVNESLLTGESELIEKNIGNTLMSGSFISSGEVFVKVINVGKDNYATKLQNEATYHKKINSQIMSSLNKILVVCSIIILPIGVSLFLNKIFINHLNLQDTVSSIVGALIGMIPEGLILLTSSVLAVSVIRLAKQKVLVQQLYCIETLARVDVLCLDKTGTITTGDMEVVSIDYLINDKSYVDKSLKSLTKNSVDHNATIKAIDNFLNCDYNIPSKIIPFSSEKKWSGANVNNKAYLLGAAEILLDNYHKEILSKISSIPNLYRVVLFAESQDVIENNMLPSKITPLAIVIIKDKIRDNAKETINYFNNQGVNLKIISGDNHKTVENIAKAVGVIDADKSIDATTLLTDEDIEKAVNKYTVFGRVTPQQKKKIIVALKNQGHTVAMTGDGVNDVLALKESDCSVAIASGSDAAKNISQLVLVNDDFGSMPKVVAEGRRTINNIQRSGSLFLVKTIYSIILAVAYIFFSSQYPFEPIHLTLISAFTVGIPSFVLALEPNHNIVKGRFIKNILLNALPSGIVVSLNVLILGVFSKYFTQAEISTMATIITTIIGILLVFRLSVPFNALRIALMAVIIGGFSLAVLILGKIVGLVPLSTLSFITLLIMAVVSVVVFNIIFTLLHNMAEKQ